MATELSADIRLGKVSDDLMERLRYDTMFTSHRQDVFNTLTNKVMLKDDQMAKVDQQKLMLDCEQQGLCRLGQIKIQYEFCTVIMLLKISILSLVQKQN
ncbi:hypothetical protein ACLB1Q_35080 [Escherichia coli]